MHIKENGIIFNYQIDGAQHAPWLIFSNSLATNFSMWDDQTRSLSGSFRILRYDQRGHGKTEAPEGRYPFAILLADAVARLAIRRDRRRRPHIQYRAAGNVHACSGGRYQGQSGDALLRRTCLLLTQSGHFAFIQLCSRSIQLALELSGREPSQTISQSTTDMPVDQTTDAEIIARIVS